MTPPFHHELDLLTAYRTMALIRRFEEKAGQLYGMGLIAGFCHLYIGHEAVVVGLQALAQPQDSVITAYRDHGHMLACGMDPKGVMAELTGRAGGSSQGKGGSMHMFSREKNFYGGHGIVGAQVPLGAGLGFAHQYAQDGGVSFTYVGDGGANQGQVYEAYNMAALWKLPVVFIIENNGYAMGTSVARHAAGSTFHERAAPWGIPHKMVDGMDVMAVYDGCRDAVAHARSGQGPYVIEAKTYRYRGHSMSDPATYRSKDEVQTMRDAHDPIAQLRAFLLTHHKVAETTLAALDKEVKAIVDEAVDFAKTSPEPAPQELYTDVYHV